MINIKIFSIIKILFLSIDLKKVKMRKIYCIKFIKHEKFIKPKMSYICYKTLLLPSICNQCWSEDEKISKEESIGILECFIMEENINQEFRLKKIDEIKNYSIEEIYQNKLMSKKHKKVWRVLNYVDHSLIVISTIIVCVSISAFASLVSIPIGITSPAIGL